MVKIVLVNGVPGCGKTTFETLCQTLCYQDVSSFRKNKRLAVDIYSTIDFVKEIAIQCGWDGVKTPRNRKFLSDLKDLLTEWGDVPLKKIYERIQELKEVEDKDWILFIDCREPAEIQKLKECLNATTVLIRRPGDTDIQTSNHADSEVFNYNYDLTIWNNSDIIHLEDEARKFIKYIKKEEVPYYVNVD